MQSLQTEPLLQAVKASIDRAIAIEEALASPAAGRLIDAEKMIEAAALLIDHDDMVDIGTQPIKVRLRRGRARTCARTSGENRVSISAAAPAAATDLRNLRRPGRRIAMTTLMLRHRETMPATHPIRAISRRLQF